MKAIRVGDRVGAIFSSDGDKVRFLGFGVYVGDVIPPENILFGGEPLDFETPKIDLDSGKSVYGFECWWGSEEKIKSSIESFRVIENIDIDDVRDECK